MAYKYERPDGELHKVSLRKWHRVFARRGMWPLVVAYVYVGTDKAVVHYKLGIIGRMAVVILAPVLYLIGLFAEGHRESVRQIQRVLFQGRCGAFTSDVVYNDTSGWDRLMEFLEDK